MLVAALPVKVEQFFQISQTNRLQKHSNSTLKVAISNSLSRISCFYKCLFRWSVVKTRSTFKMIRVASKVSVVISWLENSTSKTARVAKEMPIPTFRSQKFLRCHHLISLQLMTNSMRTNSILESFKNIIS